MFHPHTPTETRNTNGEGFLVTSGNLKKKAGSLHGIKMIRSSARRILLALAAAGTIGGVALAVPAAASAATQPSAVHATSAGSYGEFAEFHCSSGQVSFDNL